MTDKCRGFMGRIRCNFQPRYDGQPVSPDHIRAMAEFGNALRDFNMNGGETYVCDVCTACGEQRKRP